MSVHARDRDASFRSGTWRRGPPARSGAPLVALRPDRCEPLCQLAPGHAVDHTVHVSLDTGDLDGYAVWKRIVKAVAELMRAPGDATVH